MGSGSSCFNSKLNKLDGHFYLWSQNNYKVAKIIKKNFNDYSFQKWK